ncbi:MAG: Lrp/AsnC ligand binding domain-containing protein [Pyrinomonadaceae bacterium]
MEVAERTNEVLECHRGTGGDSFIMKVAVASVEHLQNIIDRLTPYGITTTSVVLSSPVKRRVIKPYNPSKDKEIDLKFSE